jgi:heme oxygenase
MSLKDLTAEKHADAERTAFAAKLLSGSITDDEYAAYLTQMMSVYAVLEHQAALCGHMDGLAGLGRCRAIHEDLKEICPDKFFSVLPSTRQYVEYLETLVDSENGSKKLLAHLYVRHMGDLYGGQMIAKKVPGSGKFYKFNNRSELISKIREKLTDDLGDEANVAFDFAINIMKELNECSLEQIDPSKELI